MKLRVEELTILTNTIADEVLEFSLPQYRAELVRISYVDGRVLSLTADDELGALESILRSMGCLRPPVSRHLFWDALTSAGVLQPPNMDELLNLMGRATRFDPSDPRQKVLAVDTNVLYNCTLTLAAGMTRSRPPITVSGCILYEIAVKVQKETDREEAKWTRQLAGIRGSRKLGDELAYTWCLERRRGLAALREYERVKLTYPFISTPRRKCRGDAEVARDYSRLMARGVNTVLVTHDRQMYSTARAHDLPVILLKPPKRKLDGIPLTCIPEVIYHLSVNFGLVRVSGEKGWAIVRSAWRGASDEEAVKGILLVESSPEVEGEVLSEVEVARSVLRELA